VAELLAGYGGAFESHTVSIDASNLASAQRGLDELGRRGPAFGLVGSGASEMSVYVLRDPALMDRLAPDAAAAWRELDVSVLQTAVLDPLLPGHSERDASVTYTRDLAEALRDVRSGEVPVAFVMSTPSVGAMASVADARARMPEKSTYFYPKVPTGMVMRSIA
jgi:hypothetical protein